MLYTHLDHGDPVPPEEATMGNRGAGTPTWGWRRANPFKDRFELRMGGRVVATLDRHWSGRGGTLRLAQGGRLEWRRVGWWRPLWEFADRFGNPLVRLRPDGSVVDCVLGDELAGLAEPWSDVLLLLALAWFLLVIGGHAVPPRLEPAIL